MSFSDIIIMDGLYFALPLFIMAIGGIYSEKSGITNLALEGFQAVGAFVGAFSVVFLSQYISGPVPYYVSFLCAVAGGGIFAVLHAVLCIRFKANQVISGVVMNILALALTTFLTKRLNSIFFGHSGNKFMLPTSSQFSIPILKDIPVLGAVFTNIYPFEVLILILALIMGYILYCTVFGMRLRACGDNPHSVDAAGIDVNRVRTIAVIISGCLSGIAGVSFAYSISANFSSGIYLGYGYLSIAALIFGNWTILPTFWACLLFGFARSGGTFLILRLGLPSSYNDLVRIFPYVLTLILLVFFSHNNHAPRALGEPYEKGKR